MSFRENSIGNIYLFSALQNCLCYAREIWDMTVHVGRGFPFLDNGEEIRDRGSHNIDLIVLGFNDTSTLVGHFVSSPREREKSDRRDSRRDEREGQGRKRNRNESEETEEIKTSPPYPYPLQG